MKTYLVTGAAGFIGARTADLLLDQGHQVIGIDNLNNYYDQKLKNERLHLLKKHSKFIFRPIDIEEAGNLQTLFSEFTFDAILHLAARAGVGASMKDPEVYVSTNVMGTLHLLNLSRDFKVKKFILASTSSVYAGSALPFHEDLPVNEPLSPYAATKKAAEALAYSYHHLYGIDVSVVRYFTVYGPMGRPDMSPFIFTDLILQKKPLTIFGTGEQARDFTFVDDIAHGTILALKPLGFEVINLGGGNHPVSLKTMIGKIEDLTGIKAEITYQPSIRADMDQTWAEISKAKRLLGWEPKISLDQGLKLLVEWHRMRRC